MKIFVHTYLGLSQDVGIKLTQLSAEVDTNTANIN